MKKLLSNSVLLFMVIITIASCSKQTDLKNSNSVAASSLNNATAICQPVYFQLSVSATGDSYMYRVLGSPSSGPVIPTPIIGSFGDHVIREMGSNIPITWVTGIAYDTTSPGTFFATTGPASNRPNRLLRFLLSDVNMASHVPLVASIGTLVLNVSDIEFNQASGRYYAINRGTVSPNNRIVEIIPANAINVIALSSAVPVARQIRGLTFSCNTSGIVQGYVMKMFGQNGRLFSFNTTTGATTLACNYSGVVAPGAAPGTSPEMGLHYDCLCINKFITGNYDVFSGAGIYTDGVPACIGTFSYASLPYSSASIDRPVDFATP